jgi:hypothetical protein
MTSQGSDETLGARDVSVLQGSLRSKQLWMEPLFGELVLLHYRLEQTKRKKKQQQQRGQGQGQGEGEGEGEGQYKENNSDGLLDQRESGHGGREEEQRAHAEEEEYIMNEMLQAMERREIMCRIIS